MPVHFGDFTLDESRRQGLREGDPLRLSPKAFQLLSILIQESPRAISKNDLQERLWPETFVTEGNLPTLVTELRSAARCVSKPSRRSSRIVPIRDSSLSSNASASKVSLASLRK